MTGYGVHLSQLYTQSEYHMHVKCCVALDTAMGGAPPLRTHTGHGGGHGLQAHLPVVTRTPGGQEGGRGGEEGGGGGGLFHARCMEPLEGGGM